MNIIQTDFVCYYFECNFLENVATLAQRTEDNFWNNRSQENLHEICWDIYWIWIYKQNIYIVHSGSFAQKVWKLLV